MLHHVIDRRLSGKNKSIGNRERFLRRYRDQIRDVVKRAVSGRGIRDMERGEDISLPRHDLSEPAFGHASGGRREMVHPGNEEFVRGDRIKRPRGGGGQRQRPGRRTRRQQRRRLRLPDFARRIHCSISSTIWHCRIWCEPSCSRIRLSGSTDAPAI